jgi:hypothetical protein
MLIVNKLVLVIAMVFVTTIAAAVSNHIAIPIDPSFAAIVGAIPAAVIDDPSWNAQMVAQFRCWSITTLNRNIREGKHPPADYTNGPYRFWKASTARAAREADIAASAAEAAQRREVQLEDAARARAASKRKQAAAASPSTDTVTT